MPSVRRLLVLAGVLSVALPVIASAASARPATGSTEPVQFVVGTYAVAGQSALGTFWGWHTPQASDVASMDLTDLQLTGPPGWNNGAPVHGCAVFNGMAPTICLGWKPFPVRPGLYTAEGSSGTFTATALTTSHVQAPRITKAVASGSTIAVSWQPVQGAHAYIVAATPAGAGTCCDLQNQVVPAGARSYDFQNVGLTKGRSYRVGVFALSDNVLVDAPLTQPFEIGEGHVTVVAGGATKSGGGKVAAKGRIRAQVHGSALVGGSSVKILDLRVEGVPNGTSIVFRCLKGCSISEEVGGSSVVHSHALRGKTVPSGAVIEVRATKPGYIGFYDRLVMHANALAFFTQQTMCLAPNKTQPYSC